jgi:hypothetical protein
LKELHVNKALVVAMAIAAMAAFAGPAAAGGPTASASKTCKPATYPGNGYFTSLAVRNVGCSTGRKLQLDHYRCRRKHGIRGRCSSVDGYRCGETRESISTEFDARVTCKRGTRKVVFTYQQNT